MGEFPYPDLVDPLGNAHELAQVIPRYDAQILGLTTAAACTRRHHGVRDIS